MRAIGAIFARWRVRLGYPLAVIVLWLARPTPRSIALGGLIGLFGLLLRAYAAGFLDKQRVLTVDGPYAFTRNPLYLGSFILAAGAAVATRSWLSAGILMCYFSVVYAVVMRREESELRVQHGEIFDEYARAVPLFFPRLLPTKRAQRGKVTFSFAQYRKNHEYQAAAGFVFLLVALLIIWHLRMA